MSRFELVINCLFKARSARSLGPPALVTKSELRVEQFTRTDLHVARVINTTGVHMGTQTFPTTTGCRTALLDRNPSRT